PERRISTTVDLREALGSDVLVHVPVDTPPAITEDVKELATDVDPEKADLLHKTSGRDGAGTANVVARLNPRSHVRPGDRIELVVDTERIHFFDPDDGSGIYGGSGAGGV